MKQKIVMLEGGHWHHWKFLVQFKVV